jgi:transcription initiation factor TFIIH subunit 2
MEGYASFQNPLELACQHFEGVPGHVYKEVLIINSSLTVCDPADISQTISKLKQLNVQVNAISLSASLFVLQHICVETGGLHCLARDKDHLNEQIKRFLTPSQRFEQSDQMQFTTKIPIGFPKRLATETPTVCACHGVFNYTSYYCPGC